MTRDDDILDDLSIGVAQTAAIDAAKAESAIRSTLRHLDVDLRSSMPQDVNSVEYRLRDALNGVIGVKRELAEKGEMEDEL